MELGDINDRSNLFVDIVDQLNGKEVVDNIYHIITTYGIPEVADETFLKECLMKIYLQTEEYEKCNVLKKNEFKTKVSYDSIEDLDEEVPLEDIKYMALMGFFKSIKITSL